MRFLLALALLAVVALLSTLASTSCAIDYRDPEASMDAEAGSSPVGDGGLEAEASDAQLDCGCCNQAILPGLPDCSGKVAFALPAADCKVPCPGRRVAYALCGGGCYTACECDLPAGYTLFDAGYVIGEVDPGPEGGLDVGTDAADATGGS